jgi:hypothetical protein
VGVAGATLAAAAAILAGSVPVSAPGTVPPWNEAATTADCDVFPAPSISPGLTIYFEPGSAELDAVAVAKLTRFSRCLVGPSGISFVAFGTSGYSEARYDRVREFLVRYHPNIRLSLVVGGDSDTAERENILEIRIARSS